MARDAGTKIDKPSDQEGKGTPAKEELESKQAAQAEAKEKASEKAAAPKPKAPRKPTTPQAEGTAAAKTGVDKAAAEEALEAGSAESSAAPEEPAAEEKPAAEEQPAAEEKPAARAKPAGEGKPAAAPRARTRGRREAGAGVTVRAQAKYVRTSARKARLVAEHIRGKKVDEARSILAFHPRSVAEDWRKLLDSAIANAEHNHDLVGDDLRVLNATADEGPTLKRFRPRAMGRATRIRKRTSHLTITLTPKA